MKLATAAAAAAACLVDQPILLRLGSVEVLVAAEVTRHLQATCSGHTMPSHEPKARGHHMAKHVLRLKSRATCAVEMGGWVGGLGRVAASKGTVGLASTARQRTSSQGWPCRSRQV